MLTAQSELKIKNMMENMVSPLVKKIQELELEIKQLKGTIESTSQHVKSLSMPPAQPKQSKASSPPAAPIVKPVETDLTKEKA